MRFSALAALLTFAATSDAAPAPIASRGFHAVHEKRHETPAQWVKRERVQVEAILPVRVGLKQRNLEKGHDFLMEV